MALSIKCLWAEYLVSNHEDEQARRFARFWQHVEATGVNAVCVRSESLSKDFITQLHHKGLKVYGWCYPHARPATDDPKDDRSFAPNEAAWVAELVGYGLDGYVFDIESQTAGRPNDWSKTGAPDREKRAADMVSVVAGAFKKRGGPYLLGLTSHQWGFANYPGVPWQQFLDECNVLFPQTYWRMNNGGEDAKACTSCSWDYSVHPIKLIGSVDQALKNGFIDYADKKDRAGKVLPIIPLIGEIGCTKSGEIKAAWQLIQAKGIDLLHVYVDVKNVGWINDHTPDPSILDEIKAIA